MWYQITDQGIENFARVVDNTMRTKYRFWKRFSDDLRSRHGSTAPKDTTLKGLTDPDQARVVTLPTVRYLDGELLIPMTNQFYSIKELAWLVAGEFPVRFYESDPRGGFAAALLKEISDRDHTVERAAGEMGISPERLERILALNGKCLEGPEYFDVLVYYSSDPEEQRDLARLLGAKVDPPPTAIRTGNGKQNGKAAVGN